MRIPENIDRTKAKLMAEKFLRDYARECRVSYSVALRCAVTDDAHPLIHFGQLILWEEAGINK